MPTKIHKIERQWRVVLEWHDDLRMGCTAVLMPYLPADYGPVQALQRGASLMGVDLAKCHTAKAIMTSNRRGASE